MVQRRIYRDIEQLWEKKKIEQIYFTYKDGIEKRGQQVYDTGNETIVPWVAENSGYSEGDVRIELFFIRDLAITGEMDKYFWNFQEPTTATVRIAQQLNPEDIFKKFKWIAILSITGLAIFYGGPVIARQLKKRKKENG